jgi:hypothetical protein
VDVKKILSGEDGQLSLANNLLKPTAGVTNLIGCFGAVDGQLDTTMYVKFFKLSFSQMSRKQERFKTILVIRVAILRFSAGDLQVLKVQKYQ